MKKNMTLFYVLLAAIGLTICVAPGLAMADDDELCYEVTVTNMTRAQVFTPVLVVTHKYGLKLFTVGEAASDELAYLAEEGDPTLLADLLATMTDHVGAIAISEGGPFGPGESKTVLIPASGRYKLISLASMLAVTNDGFIALNGVPAKRRMYTSPVYDAGSEVNDELAINIPGRGGVGFESADGEGFVHIHAGIHGIGDLPASNMDWRNPAAKIMSKRVHCEFDD